MPAAPATCAILQPHYLPWLGYLEMIDRVDVFVFLDDADFIKREWKNRNRVREGPYATAARWLTVPIARDCQQGTPILAARINDDHAWVARHLDALRFAYRKAPRFDAVFPELETMLATRYGRLAELNIALLDWMCGRLGIATPRVRASSLGVPGRKTERLIGIAQAVGAYAYLANNASAAYLDEAAFAEAGIALAYQDYRHPVYGQFYAGTELPFLPQLSVIDLLMNQTPEMALATIRSGRP